MKRSIFFSSFFSMNCSGSKPLTSPAKRVANADASNRVMGPMPLTPPQRASQLAWIPMPTGDTRPRPVTTTRLLNIPPSLRPSWATPSLLLGVRLDVVDRLLDARDLLGVLVRNLDPELLLERHHELDGVERVGAEVVDERCVR